VRNSREHNTSQTTSGPSNCTDARVGVARPTSESLLEPEVRGRDAAEHLPRNLYSEKDVPLELRSLLWATTELCCTTSAL